MVNERRATLHHDSGADLARLVVLGAGPAAGPAVKARVSLLLDAKGALVGVDLGGEGLARMVVMIGPHESVATTRDATVEVVRGAAGEPLEVRIPDARAMLRA